VHIDVLGDDVFSRPPRIAPQQIYGEWRNGNPIKIGKELGLLSLLNAAYGYQDVLLNVQQVEQWLQRGPALKRQAGYRSLGYEIDAARAPVRGSNQFRDNSSLA
jgi:hypothetical protein